MPNLVVLTDVPRGVKKGAALCTVALCTTLYDKEVLEFFMWMTHDVLVITNTLNQKLYVSWFMLMANKRVPKHS